MPEIGRIALGAAFVAALYAALAGAYAARSRRSRLLTSSRAAVGTAFILVSLAALALVYALLSHDFRLEQVALHTRRDMGLAYLLGAFWAGNEGSLLFWTWLLSLFGAVLLVRRGNLGAMSGYAMSTVMAVLAFFLFLTVFLLDPFGTLPLAPEDGRGLNPLLENPAMLFHPPALLAGYAAFTIPFAFAIGALLSGELDNEWVTRVWRWTLLAWLLLGVGNLLGAQWAYVELGWGGYWGWDPVENAGLMPWLTATAFLHSSLAQRRRGLFRIWNLVLAIVPFNLIVLGAFITRGGVISSPHAFPKSAVGVFLLAFLVLSFCASLGLLLYRWQELRGERHIRLDSKEGLFGLNNVMMAAAAAFVLWGTATLRGDGVATTFNRIMGPAFLAIIVLMGACASLAWSRGGSGSSARKLAVPAAAAPAAALALFMVGVRGWLPLMAFSLCVSVFTAIMGQWAREVRMRREARAKGLLWSFLTLLRDNRSRYGGYLSHVGVVVMAMGVIGSSFYVTETRATLRPGETMVVHRYTLQYEGMTEDAATNSTRARLSVYNGGDRVAEMSPQRYFPVNYPPVAETAVRWTLREDLYVVLDGWNSGSATPINAGSATPINTGSATFKVMVVPLVTWIWIGGAVLFLGGAVALWPGGKRRTTPLVVILNPSAEG